MVNLTRIYTRTGDGGETRLGDMSTTSKNDLRLHAYADVDEANAHLGVALAVEGLEDDVVTVLTHVQNDLFDVGADFCTPVVTDPEFPPLRIEQDYIDRLEGWCDHYNESLPALRSFILNGGTPGRRPPPRRPHRRTACRAVGLGGARRARGHDEPARNQVPQPTLRPTVHPRQTRQSRARGRAVGAGGRAVEVASSVSPAGRGNRHFLGVAMAEKCMDRLRGVTPGAHVIAIGSTSGQDDQQHQPEDEQNRAPVQQLDARHHPEAGHHPLVSVRPGSTTLTTAVEGKVESTAHHRESRDHEDERRPGHITQSGGPTTGRR